MRDTMVVLVRRLILGLALATVGAGAASAQGNPTNAPPQSGAGTLKVGFIRARQILRQMPGYAKAESTWTKEAESVQQEIQRMQQNWDSTMRAFSQAQAMMTASARSAREKVLAAQSDSLEAKSTKLRERIDTRERELLTPMQTRLQAVIDGVRAEGNYAMVIDLDNPASANIISYDKSLDLTDRVTRRVLQSN